MIAPLDGFRERAAAYRRATGRPFVTLTYAQSLDGCLTLHAGQPSPISGPESLVMTHQLRAAHDAILIGIGTVLADDPSLRTRLAEGVHPQPVVLDSHLRLPIDSRLLTLGRRPLIAAVEPADSARCAALEAAGAQVLRVVPGDDGRVSLSALLGQLGQTGINSVMVEGGAQVTTSFLRARLPDLLVLTIAPVMAGGLHAVGDLGLAAWSDLPYLRDVGTEWAGRDLIMWGTPVWGEGE